MLKVVDNPEFTHVVSIMVPKDGGHQEETLKCRFRVIGSELADSFEITEVEGLKLYLRAVIVTMADLVDGDGKPLEFNDNVLEAVLNLPYARIGLFRAYNAAVTKVRQGN